MSVYQIKEIFMPDRIEEILKQIHVMFAKCESFQNSTDLVVVSKVEMFRLLEQLNEALDEVLDRYEATTRSRERARLDMDRQAQEVVAKAKQDSDDVHAATLLYTDTMLEDVKQILEKTKENVKREMLELLAGIELQQETLDQNKDGVKADLTDLHDSELYLKTLTDIRVKAEAKRNSQNTEGNPDEDAEEGASQSAPNIVIRVSRPGENSGVTFTKRGRKAKDKKKGSDSASPEVDENGVPLDHEEGTPFNPDDFDLDAEYEEWKEKQDGDPDDKGDKPKKKKFKLFG